LTGFETVDDVGNASQIRLHRHDNVFLVHKIRVRHFIDVEIHMGTVLVPIDPNFTLFGFFFVETHVDHVGHFHLPHWIGGQRGEGDQITVQIGKIFFRFRTVRRAQSYQGRQGRQERNRNRYTRGVQEERKNKNKKRWVNFFDSVEKEGKTHTSTTPYLCNI